MSNDPKGTELFRNTPVVEAVLRNSLPAMLAMLMVLVYNLADTFFIGQTHDALMVTAISLATPVFLIFMSFGTIFGIGGTSLIARSLGEGKTEYARKACAFCMWGCVAVGVVLAACFLLFMDPLLRMIGASADTWEMTKSYLTIISFAGPFVLIANCFNNIIRSEGRPGKAMMGQMIGNILNVVLDPIFILALHMNVTGAAIATVIGNIVSAGYYIFYFIGSDSILSIRMKDVMIKNRVMRNVFAIGVPAAFGTVLMSVANIVANAKLAGYGDLAVAGYGVASKVLMICGMVCIGLGQGVQPLIGFCIGAKLIDRLKQVMRFSLLFGLGLSTVMTVITFFITRQLVGVFVNDPDALGYGIKFTHILLTTAWFFGPFFVLMNTIQAAGAAKEALILNLSRQGLVYIPTLFILDRIIGMTGIIWAQPAADVMSMLLLIYFYKKCMGKLKLQ